MHGSILKVAGDCLAVKISDFGAGDWLSGRPQPTINKAG
jgi:hypothetical protein